jgi:ABC-type uncharacterized transport system YnjBCD ATPase subunit
MKFEIGRSTRDTEQRRIGILLQDDQLFPNLCFGKDPALHPRVVKGRDWHPDHV